MHKFTGLDFYDFIFNNHNLSEFGGYVGSTDGGLKTYSILPARARVKDRPLNSDITYEFASSLEPRVFEVPVVFEQLSDGDLRKIAAWLDSPTPSKFMFVGDDVYINATLDENDFSAQSSTGQDAQIALKFVCNDPFYYENNLTQYTLTSLTSGKAYSYTNHGYGELFPYITLACSGTVKIEILDSNGDVYTTTNITDITGGVKIDSATLECTLLSGASHFAYIDNFPVIPQGDFSIKVTGSSLTNMTIEYRVKYI